MSEQQTNLQPANSSKLLELNSQLNLANGIYQNTSTQIRDSRLSSYIQGAVNDSLDNAQDQSLYSIDIEKLLLTDELRTAFTPAPVNFLLSFDFSNIGHTLDLTQGFGGATHFLADKVSTIDCVRVDSGHARLSAKRCSAFSNISYISEDIAQLKFPKKHYDLIVISQLESLELDKTEQSFLLEELRRSLSTSGRIVISVKNRDRLNKWVSMGQDSIAYKSLYSDETDTYYNEAELNHLITAAGFIHSDVYASFSSSQGIQNIFSKPYLANNPHSLNHFNRLGGFDNNRLNEYLLFKNLLSERNEVFNFASRFLIIAGASAQATQGLCNNDFAHYSGIGRKPQWRATTQSKHGSNQVSKTLIHERYQNVSEDVKLPIQLSQTTAPQTFQPGPLLLDKWLSALLEPEPVSALKTQISQYLTWLRRFEKEPDFCSRAYDALPFNIIVDAEGQFNTIDPEWLINTQFDADFVLFRALFWFAFENKALMNALAKQSGAATIGLFVLHFMDNIEHLSELSQYVEMEEVIQRQIGQNFRNKSVEYALLQTFDGEPIIERLQPACQISWSNDAGIVDEHNSVFMLWNASRQEQTLSIQLPALVDEKNILRVDPIASMGIFRFSSIKLLSNDNSSLWALNSTDEIAASAKGLNVSPINREIEKGQVSATHFIALNEDPHFLFDLKEVQHLQSASRIEITFALIHNQYYDNALMTLSRAVSAQNSALSQQISVLDTKQADLEYLASKLKNIDQHRQSLQASMHEANQAHEEHAKNLTQALNAQIERNQQLENNPLIKVILRIRRLVSSGLGLFAAKK